MLKAVKDTALDTINKISQIRDLLDSTIIQVRNESPKVYKKELVELLFEQPYSKIAYIGENQVL